MHAIGSDSVLDYYLTYYHHYKGRLSRFNVVFQRYLSEEITSHEHSYLHSQLGYLPQIVEFVESDQFPLFLDLIAKNSPDAPIDQDNFSAQLKIIGKDLPEAALSNLVHIIKFDSYRRSLFDMYEQSAVSIGAKTMSENIQAIFFVDEEINEAQGLFFLRSFLTRKGFVPTYTEIIAAIKTARQLKPEYLLKQETVREQRSVEDWQELVNYLAKVDSDSVSAYYVAYYHHFKEQQARFNQLFKKYVIEELYPYDDELMDCQLECLAEIVKFIESEQYPLLKAFVDRNESENESSLLKLSDLLAYRGISISSSALRILIMMHKVEGFVTFVFASFRQAVEGVESHSVSDYVRHIYREHADITHPDSLFLLRAFLKRTGFNPTQTEILEAIRVEQLLEFEHDLFNAPSTQDFVTLLDSLENGYKFEDFLAELFKRAGYDVTRTPYSKDMGADLVLKNGREVTIIQAKKMSSVGIAAVQQIVAAKNYYKAAHCMVISTGDYTQAARALAEANDVTLWSHDDLVCFLKKTS